MSFWLGRSMYDMAPLRAAFDAWYAAVLDRLADAGIDCAMERDAGPDAVPLLRQTCGYPLTHALQGQVQPVATPVYGAEGCDGPSYRSAVVVRDDDRARRLLDLRGRIAAVNGPDSHSGMNALRHAVAPLARDGGFFGQVLTTGAHAASAAAVRDGVADVAALDCVTFALLQRHDPYVVDGLRVLAWTEPAPGLPYVTGPEADAATVELLRQALAAPAPPELLLRGFEPLPLAAYARIDEIEQAALAAGYPELA